ncbi:MAG: O-antigen ligase family protein [Prolixibacteraceae bacterium]
MPGVNNPFESGSGSDRTLSPLYILLLVIVMGIFAWLTSQMNLAVGLILIGLPFVFIYLVFLFKRPVLGLYTAVVFSFLLNGMGRYFTNIPLGLMMDGILIGTFISLFFSQIYRKVDWTLANKDITWLAIFWFAYALLEFFNPEFRSMGAWISGIRSVSFYMLMIVPLALILMNTNRHLTIFFYLWGGFSLLVSLKGIIQNFIGVDPWEQAWLNQGGAVTHVIFGNLRIFSFLSDAGQFGANQAYSALVAGILFFTETTRKNKIFFASVAILGFYGMILSGTRGAISVPIAGLAAFIVLRKNFLITISGILLLILIVVFFKFTYIGQGNQYIRRTRSAFDMNDPSFQVRLENQQKLRVYLATRPFGGGLGQAGVKAQRFLPDTYLSSIPTDSWYVMIWAEEGIVGLLLHLFILFYIVGKSSYLIMFKIRDPILKMKMAALTSGMFGVIVASYGNQVLGSLPTCILIYISMALMINSEKLDDQQMLILDETTTK